MIYSAPRRGLFAIIILISLTLNVLFFVVHSERELNARDRLTAQREAILLAEGLTTSLSINDRIGMSVLGSRHIRANEVAFIGIYDANENLLVPIGSESTGITVREPVTNRSNILGYVTIQLHSTNRAEIISQSWVYLLAVTFLHIVLWLLYGYLARPTNKLRLEIAHDVRNRLLAKGLLHDAKHHGHHDFHPENNPSPNADFANHRQSKTEHSDGTKHTNHAVGTDSVVVQIIFDDPHELLSTVSNQTKNVYFSLCQQLTHKAIKEMLAKPLFYGVILTQMSEFDDKGCQITLSGQDKYSKTALAGVMFAHLMLMLNQIIYAKHRELKRFALNMRSFVSCPDRQDEVVNVGIKHREMPLVLLPAKTLEVLSVHGDFAKLTDPLSVAERECRHSKNISVSHIQTIEQVRDKVLLSH